MSDYELTDEDYDSMAEATHREYLEDQQSDELRRLRTQLGCVKALATLWEERAVQMEDKAASSGVPSTRVAYWAQADLSRVDAATLREMLAD